MQPLKYHSLSRAALALYLCVTVVADTSTSPTITSTTSCSPYKATSPPSNATCESRTINYITHSLASICLRQNRTHLRTTTDSASSTSSLPLEGTSIGRTEDAASPASQVLSRSLSSTDVGPTPSADVDPDSALDDASFLSFEEWKKQTLEKEVEPAIVDRRRDGDKRRKADGLEGLVEGEDIDLDFGAFLGDRPGDPAPTRTKEEPGPSKASQSPSDEEQGQNPRYRSKDAGKTCKERSNFASLDTGAQVMKSNPEAKSASALLKEDRDVYMLNTCQAKNKFFIVEMSESILVETVALANFEFFSSTFRQFRVSVSDKYPVKLERWVEIGLFEARNSREIQAFLVEDPRIWARYLRIEFLSHFGNEFYCPVSLLRVHGRTMIQDVLNMEQGTAGEDDGDDEQEELSEGQGEILVPEAVAEVLQEEKKSSEGLKEALAAIDNLVKTAEDVTHGLLKESLVSSHIMEVNQWLGNISTEQRITSWNKEEQSLQVVFDNYNVVDICQLSEMPAALKSSSQEALNTAVAQGDSDLRNLSASSNVTGTGLTPTSTKSLQESSNRSFANARTPIDSPKEAISSTISSTGLTSPSLYISVVSKAQNATTTAVSKLTVSSTSHSPQPTTQESFFKNVSKRLQLLEANSSLSLKYIEEQSKILREAFTKVEKRQLTKTTSFLENLNSTVLEELRQFGKQYDQIWQSTVMELEMQRDLSQRETAAVSARLNILADELVFQKRMSIVQSVLLLLCLGVVIFSRSLTAGYLEVPIIQNMMKNAPNASNYPYPSPPESPETQRGWSPPEEESWSGPDHRRQRSDESIHSMISPSPDDSPPTPFSNYSRHEEFEASAGKDNAGYNSDSNPLMWGVDTASSPEENSRTKLPFALPNGKGSPSRGSPKRLPSNRTTPRVAQNHKEILPDVARPAPNDVFSPVLPNNERTYTNPDQIGTAISPPSAPSSPSRVRASPEFSIARKPLPALPREN